MKGATKGAIRIDPSAQGDGSWRLIVSGGLDVKQAKALLRLAIIHLSKLESDGVTGSVQTYFHPDSKVNDRRK